MNVEQKTRLVSARLLVQRAMDTLSMCEIHAQARGTDGEEYAHLYAQAEKLMTSIEVVEKTKRNGSCTP